MRSAAVGLLLMAVGCGDAFSSETATEKDANGSETMWTDAVAPEAAPAADGPVMPRPDAGTDAIDPPEADVDVDAVGDGAAKDAGDARDAVSDGCAPTSCASHLFDCGMLPDGCGHMLDCGSCSGSGIVCANTSTYPDAGGTAGVCVLQGATTNYCVPNQTCTNQALAGECSGTTVCGPGACCHYEGTTYVCRAVASGCGQ